MHKILQKKYLGSCIYNGIAYRGIYVDLDKIDINNLESSTDAAIWRGQVDSFSIDKKVVDNFKNQNFNGEYIEGKNTPVKIQFTPKDGIYFNIFWKELKEIYIEVYDEEGKDIFSDTYSDVDKSFKNEEEVAAILTDGFTIYNLEEIKDEVLKYKKG
jgi:hypothetical protein